MAVDMLDEVAAAGAVLIKWLPLSQNIDVRDPRTVAFLRRAAEIGMPVLIHCGEEFTLGNMHPEFADPSGLLETLRLLRREDRMPTVIVAHAATPSTWPLRSDSTYRILADALTGEFADAPLYSDIAALALPNKVVFLRRLLRNERLRRKLVYGSDFPIPTFPTMLRPLLGQHYRSIRSCDSWLDRDVLLKQALGMDDEILNRAATILRILPPDPARSP